MLPIIEIEKEVITTYISNDTNKDLLCAVQIQLIDAGNGEILKAHSHTTTIDAMSTSFSNVLEKFLKVASTNYYLHAEISVDGEMVSKRNIIPNWPAFSRNNDMTRIKKIFLSN